MFVHRRLVDLLQSVSFALFTSADYCPQHSLFYSNHCTGLIPYSLYFFFFIIFLGFPNVFVWICSNSWASSKGFICRFLNIQNSLLKHLLSTDLLPSHSHRHWHQHQYHHDHNPHHHHHHQHYRCFLLLVMSILLLNLLLLVWQKKI